MIVKFLRKSASFGGVRYNTSKVDSQKGELLSTRNFDALQGLQNLRPQDYINYLEAVSSTSSRIKYPQLHVVISAKGKEHGKEGLAAVAHDWMQGMGYGEQPYLLILHRDTANAHVHIVSTRVVKDGKKIDNSFEKIRAYEVLNEILGEKATHKVQRDLAHTLLFNLSTRAQFRMLLENFGYNLTEGEQLIKLSKFGRMLGEVRLDDIDRQIQQYSENTSRAGQIKALIFKYGFHFGKELQEDKGSFSSELTRELKLRYGLKFIFHATDGKPPYGYSVIDYSQKNVYKGSQILPLARLTGLQEKAEVSWDSGEPSNDLTNHKAEFVAQQSASSGFEKSTSFKADTVPSEPIQAPLLGLHLSDDVDDEAVHGKKRNRQNNKSTNKR